MALDMVLVSCNINLVGWHFGEIKNANASKMENASTHKNYTTSNFCYFSWRFIHGFLGRWPPFHSIGSLNIWNFVTLLLEIRINNICKYVMWTWCYDFNDTREVVLVDLLSFLFYYSFSISTKCLFFPFEITCLNKIFELTRKSSRTYSYISSRTQCACCVIKNFNSNV